MLDPPVFPLQRDHTAERWREQGPTPEKGLFHYNQEPQEPRAANLVKALIVTLMPITCREGALLASNSLPRKIQGSGWAI